MPGGAFGILGGQKLHCLRLETKYLYEEFLVGTPNDFVS